MSKFKATYQGLEGEVRVRFAPSPTGDMHVGGVRTALFNYLYARHTGGKFCLRIEDTDRKRSTPEAVQIILDGLDWLGLHCDEEPVYQSQRVGRHVEAARHMLENGSAYRCFCTPQRLDEMRVEARAAGRNLMYDRRCLDLWSDEVEANLDGELPFTVRLRNPGNEVTFSDGVLGTIIVAAAEIDDFILLRSDGSPTYMLAVVVDDLDMGITHIIRGNDHLSNTPKQILIYRSLDGNEPQFAHVPLILGVDKKRLSKRHGATSITEYRDAGYLPETIINYLGLLGWSPGDDRNEIAMDELIELFDINGIQSSSAVFDEAKLRWLNGLYIGRTTWDHVAGELDKFAAEAVESGLLETKPSAKAIRSAWDLMHSRLHTLPELFDKHAYLFRDPTGYFPKGVRKHFARDGVAEILQETAIDMAQVEPFTAETLETLIRHKSEAAGGNAGAVFHPIRLAVSGILEGAGLFDLLETLGRESVIRRLNTAVKVIRKGLLIKEILQ